MTWDYYEELELGEIDEDNDSSTVNGWAMNALGKIPEEGDCFEADGLVFKVLTMDGRRIQDLHILDNRGLETDEDEDDE